MRAIDALESPFLSLQLASDGEVPEREAGGRSASIQVLDESDRPVTDGDFLVQQGRTSRAGKLDANGRADLGDIDPAQPFLFAIVDRVSAIRNGAFFNPDDPAIEYGGTWFNWDRVRADLKPDESFWPSYRQEMTQPGAVDLFWQHEHITRRPICFAKPALRRTADVQIRAIPCQLRVGPFVRYADHERAVIWIESVTPCLARVRYRRSGATAEWACHASTVRVGGRHFALLELTGLAEDAFHDYTVELAPLPPSGPVPVDPAAVARAFPKLTNAVTDAMKAMLRNAFDSASEWSSFRTLRKVYDTQLRFATGSCRWYPGDVKTDGDTRKTDSWEPDMLDHLGKWLKKTPRDFWPHFLFLCGDQIYSDEIGDDHAKKLAASRFAARIPGPADPAGALREKLVDGAWAGRFAHRYKRYKHPADTVSKRIGDELEKLANIYRDHPDIRDIYKAYPDSDPEKKLQDIYITLRNRRQLAGKTTPDDDEAKAGAAVEQLATVRILESQAAVFRGLHRHWLAASADVRRQSSMRYGFLAYNFLLWSLPDLESQLPTVAQNEGMVAPLKPNRRAHPLAAGGVHAADFAEYAYLYERAWTSSPHVRRLLAHVPTFLIFDDHEVTDDWNFDITWVRLLHNAKDGYKMWPKTLTDALAAYFVYQGYGNKAPSQWKPDDPRVAALREAQAKGTDALPQLRRCINRACFPTPAANAMRHDDPRASFQAGLSLDWHYKLPFDPPFLVPDCRSRKRLVQGDEAIRVIDHDGKSKPMSQTIDDAQLTWIQESLGKWRGPTVFIGASVPFLLLKKPMDFMTRPETIASAWARGKSVLSLLAGLFNSTTLGIAGEAVLRVLRRATDLEHPVRDKSWRDLWGVLAGLQRAQSPIRTVVLVSGDVHHSYAMSARLPGEGVPRPELLQITSSGFKTTIRSDTEKWIGEKLSQMPFDVGRYAMVPGFFRKGGTGTPELVLYRNSVALVSALLSGAATVRVDFLAGDDDYVYTYSAGTLGQPTKHQEIAASEDAIA
jgi:hypothetical protein